MPQIEDDLNNVFINHTVNWSGPTRVGWYFTNELANETAQFRECWCEGRDLVAGRFTFVPGPADAKASPPPVDVMTRAVALAVADFLRSKLKRLVEHEFFINGSLP
jgi:hypothetical protein